MVKLLEIESKNIMVIFKHITFTKEIMSFPSSKINYVLIFYQVSNFTFLFYFIPGLDKENGACLVV
jgi:hypothetical protein